MNKKRRSVPGIRHYDGPAGGWGALKATAIAVRTQMDTLDAPATLLRTNQPDGFDCPGCAWPDKEHKSTFQFCENGAKAVTWEATNKRVTTDFLAKNSVSSLLAKSDFELEGYGRLTHPLRYDRASDTFQPVEWDDAFQRIGEVLRGLEPDQVEFYTSGRASNEAAYLFQLFAREYGTNNFPDCSNMCHEATSVGLPRSIGIGKGTVSLDDFDKTELVISIGHNPGTNHPRMMGTLHELARRNVPIPAFLNRLKEVFGFEPPAHHGHDAVQATQAMIDGRAKALICLGGNFAVAMPDHENGFPAMNTLDLSVHIGTKLNRTHLLVGKETFILPCLGRTELDVQATGRQSITVEDSMSMVHASSGKLKPASPRLRAEPAIVAGMAQATLRETRVDWMTLVEDYDRIRNLIERTIPGFENYNERIRIPGGFRMPLPPTERIWPTATGKAMFSVFDGVNENASGEGDNVLRLITLRSHDQYNTTIYALDDRYRGVFGRRDVLFMNEDDMAQSGLEHGDRVDIETALPGSVQRLEDITVVAYSIAPGSVGAYYPEANVLVPLDYLDKDSGTPSYKSVPVRLILRSKEIRVL